jgi:hypothetical protein
LLTAHIEAFATKERQQIIENCSDVSTNGIYMPNFVDKDVFAIFLSAL